MRLTDLLLAIALGALLSAGTADLSRSVAEAQTDPITFQSSTGLTSGVFTFEMLALGAMGFAALGFLDSGGRGFFGELTRGFAFALLGITYVVASLVATGVVAAVAQDQNLPVEVPLVGHHVIMGAGTFVLTGAGAAALSDNSDMAAFLGVLGFVLGGAGMGTYVGLRVRELAYDPDLVEEAHFLSWAPLGAGLIAGLAGAIAEWEGAALIAGLAMLVTTGVGIALVETAIANDTTPIPTPSPLTAAPSSAPMMVGWSGTF